MDDSLLFNFEVDLTGFFFFHRFTKMSSEEAEAFGMWAWKEINLPNLRDNIQPTRSRADLVLTKGPSHAIERVALRKV